uniref:hypothetical protein n=1 Tax=Spiroplasma citri TaxID=2133 RepID=UPI0037DD4AD1
MLLSAVLTIFKPLISVNIFQNVEISPLFLLGYFKADIDLIFVILIINKKIGRWLFLSLYLYTKIKKCYNLTDLPKGGG